MADQKKPLAGRRKAKPTRVVDLEATEIKKSSDKDNRQEARKASEIAEKSADAAAEKAQKEMAGSDAKERAETKAGKAEVPDTPVKSKTSFGALILSALLGGGVALGGASYLGQSGLLGGAGSTATTDLKAEVSTLKDQVEELSAGQSMLAPEIDKRLKVLEQGLDTAQGQTAAGSTELAEALKLAGEASTKSEEVAQQLAELNSRIVSGAGGDTVDMEAIKSALSSDLAILSSKVDGIEKSLGETANMPSVETLNAEIDAIKAKLGTLEKLSRSVEDWSAKIDQLASELAANSERLSAIETSVNEEILPSMNSVEKAAVAAVESQKVARSVSARALSAVLENGGVFTSELASAEALIGDNETINRLQALARKGVRSKSELLSGFGPVGDQIISLQNRPASDAGVLDRFLNSAQSLVKVRPAGPVEGSDDTAVVSRIEAALKNGDLQAAMKEWDGLSETARNASEGWAGQVRDYQTADMLINELIGELSAGSGKEG